MKHFSNYVIPCAENNATSTVVPSYVNMAPNEYDGLDFLRFSNISITVVRKTA